MCEKENTFSKRVSETKTINLSFETSKCHFAGIFSYKLEDLMFCLVGQLEFGYIQEFTRYIISALSLKSA